MVFCYMKKMEGTNRVINHMNEQVFKLKIEYNAAIFLVIGLGWKYFGKI